MKVYVIYDPLLERIVCVHQYPDTECPECKDVREERTGKGQYYLEEISKIVYNNAKTYDSPAILHSEENIVSADEEDVQPDLCCGIYNEKLKYYNPKTKKSEKLFDEKLLNKVYTVSYKNPYVGWKGEALYITLEANNETLAKNIAMNNKEFTKHIEMKYFEPKYLSAFVPRGNYVIGKVKYFEGDPRL